MIIETIFNETIYPNLKEYVETNSIYSPKVTKISPQDSKVFPIVPVRLLPIRNLYNNLNYGEETYNFGIEINIYATDKTVGTSKLSKKTICDEVTSKVIDYFKTNFHVSIYVEYDMPNIDTNIHRNYVRITGVLDTKYGNENLVIYP